VQVPRLFQVEALPTVFQMSSDVTAETRPGTTLVDVFRALFPCGSITGAPKVQAMRLIHSLEPEARGVYCGAIGVVRPGGHATFNVAIRTVTARQAHLRCGIGSGITHDATAEGEWQEWQAKRAFLNRASTPFELLETLRLEQGRFHAAEHHLARMARAAQHFGFVFDLATIEAALATQANAHPQGLFRVRLLLKRKGVARAESFVLAASDGTPQRVQLASTPLEATQSEFVRYKTTRREHYEVYTPTDASVFDTLLWNTRGELTESTRCNVAVKLDGEWLTPALSCGLLDGIAREELIERGQLREAVIPIEALARAEGLALFNSLRGWMPATLVSPPQAANKRG
jgi:para-aminobenzoate synthetase/4-amino-4-deoxychorismate lyase